MWSGLKFNPRANPSMLPGNRGGAVCRTCLRVRSPRQAISITLTSCSRNVYHLPFSPSLVSTSQPWLPSFLVLGWKTTIASFPSITARAVIKYPDRKQLKERGFVSAHSSGLQSMTTGESGCQGLETASHNTHS